MISKSVGSFSILSQMLPSDCCNHSHNTFLRFPVIVPWSGGEIPTISHTNKDDLALLFSSTATSLAEMMSNAVQ